MAPIKHGQAFTQTYFSWQNAKARCYTPSATGYQHYGGRGITMSDDWRQDFRHFYRDMGDCPPKHTLERIDNDGHYENGNCRWITKAEQHANTRSNVFIEWQGERHTVSEWERKLGFQIGRLKQRLYHGWTIERAMTTGRPYTIAFRGEARTVREWEDVFGFRRGTIKARLHYGWSVERAFTTPVEIHRKKH